jgi:NADP-dependent 3-hydroxy acid dehydrogenase YdfG
MGAYHSGQQWGLIIYRAVLPNMIARQTGDIINISSTAGLKMH